MNDNLQYEKTPSFYKTDEVFKKYLGSTSYYTTLQDILSKILGFSKANSVLDLGFGTGDTVVKLAKKYPDCHFKAVDMRQDMIDILEKKIQEDNLDNIEPILDDMVPYINKIDSDIDLVTMIYSFHHIVDPHENKINFLNILFEKLNPGGMVFIGETFIPEEAANELDAKAVSKLWESRSLEGYASTFWSSLDSLSDVGIEQSKGIAEFCSDFESKAGKNVEIRNDEYLVKVSWLLEKAQEAGFNIKLSEPVNCIGEYVVILEK